MTEGEEVVGSFRLLGGPTGGVVGRTRDVETSEEGTFSFLWL